MKPKRKSESREIEIIGLRCVLTFEAGKDHPRSTAAVLHAVRGVNSPKQLLEADKLARRHAATVKVEWTEPVEDRSKVGLDYREGTINGFQWRADWSVGCRVYLITGPEYRHREDVSKAYRDLEEYFKTRVRTLPDSIDVIRHTDARANQEH